MDWLLIWIGYTLISVGVMRESNIWISLLDKLLFVAGATLVTVQVLTHLGVAA